MSTVCQQRRWRPDSANGATWRMEWLDPLWDELFPAEQARIVQLL